MVITEAMVAVYDNGTGRWLSVTKEPTKYRKPHIIHNDAEQYKAEHPEARVGIMQRTVTISDPVLIKEVE